MPFPPLATADWVDEYGDALQSCELQLRQYGGRAAFRGAVTTLQVHEDNVLVRETLAEDGAGRVLVIDGGGSHGAALLGDMIAGEAVAHGWEGIVVHGVVRDVVALRGLDLGIKALGSNPRRSAKERTGRRDVAVTFGGATFAPGDEVVSDDDGVVVLPRG